VNSIDIAVGVVLVISGVISLVRGFVHEILSHTAWIVSGLAAFWAYRLPQVHEISHPYVHNDLLADIAAGAVIFIVLLVVLSFVTHAVARRVQQSALGSTDRALGFAFGLVRGLVLCSLAYMVVIWLMPQPPTWFNEAKSLPLIKVGANFIETLLPDQIAVLKKDAKDAADAGKQATDAADQIEHNADLLKSLESPQPKAPDKPDDKKPTKKDDKGLDRLIESTTGH
jgi:membrane protein required for colicin V production